MGDTVTKEDTNAASTRSNLVLVHCHDLGQYLGCYGVDVESPNLDALAAVGVRMANSFCTAPQCSPSRSSMMTGAYPHENGVMGLAHMGWSLDDDWMTLPKYLRDAGYSTHLLGFQHEVPDDPTRLGYDEFDDDTKRALDLVEVVEEFFETRADDGAHAAEGDPFFVSIGIEEPHRPFRREYLPDDLYDGPDPDDVEIPPYLPDEPGVREDVAALQALIAGTLDPAVGRMRDALEDAGLAEETLFVFTTDHGLALPRAKGTCYDPGLETALLLHQPGVVEGGAVHDDLVSNVDLTPTFLELLGIDPPADVAGQSFAPLITDGDADGVSSEASTVSTDADGVSSEASTVSTDADGASSNAGTIPSEAEYEPRDRIFGEMTWHDRYNPVRAIRTERYKYVRNFSVLPRVFVPLDVVPTPSGRAVHEEFYVEQRPAEELYDLEADPHERENLASGRTPYEPATEANAPDPEYVDALERLRAELRSWMEATDDPLLEGPVEYPAVE